MNGAPRPPLLHRLLLRLYSRAFRDEFGDAALDALRLDLQGVEGSALHRLGARAAHLLAFARHGIGNRLDRWPTPSTTPATGRAGFWVGWTQDVRLALRSAAKRPGFTLVAVASLAIGVGANGVVFAVVDTLMMREIPGTTDPDQIVELSLTLAGDTRGGWDYPDFESLGQIPIFASTALYERGPVSLSGDGAGQRLLALYVTSGYFSVVGVPMYRGRDFTGEVDRLPGPHAQVVLSYRAWERLFDFEPDIVGRVVRLNRTPYTVIGIAPPDFRGHEFGIRPDVYLPLTEYPPAARDAERFFGSRGTLWADAIGRLAGAATLDDANAALATTMEGLESEHAQNVGRGAIAAHAALMPSEGRLPASIAFGLLGALMMLVLAVASANVGGMLLARASAREAEIAVRLALGAGRVRIVRHMVTEAMVVFVAGGAAGAWIVAQGLAWPEGRALPTFVPVELEFVLDGRFIAFGSVLTLAVGLIFGLMPALRATRGHATAGLRTTSIAAHTSRLRRGFVAGQVGVAVLLLTSAVVFLRSIAVGADIETGFDPEGVYLTGFDLSLEGYHDADAAALFVSDLLEHVRGLPGVAGAAVASDYPLDGGTSSSPVWTDGANGADDPTYRAYYARVSHGYFATLGIGLTAGRTFDRRDARTTRPVAVVNRTFAEVAWPGSSPIGRTVEFGLEPREYEVVGVVENTQSDLITDGPSSQVFTLLSQEYHPELMLGVRRTGHDPDFPARVRREVQMYDPALSLGRTQHLADLADLGLLPQRLISWIAGTLGALALFLAALGVYGVVAFSVAQRTREIGLRMALGSSRRGVVTSVLRDAVLLTWPGLLGGLICAALSATLAKRLFVGVDPIDATSYATVVAVLGLVVVLAVVAPAQRASSIAPAAALRED